MIRNTNHVPVIDILRGVAASLVCFFHFVCKTIGLFENETLLGIFKFGSKGVEMFFIISGIVIPLSMINHNYSLKKIWKFILKRFIRIEPPYLAAVAVGVFYLIIRNFIPGTAPIDMTPTLKEIVLHVGYLIPFFKDAEWVNPVFWTLAVEFQYYLILSILVPLALSKKLILRSLFYLVFLFLPFLGHPSDFFTYWSAYFLIGIVYALWMKKKISNIETLVVLPLTFVMVLYYYDVADFVVAIITLGIIHFFGTYKSKVGMFLGKISYSLYLLHSLIGAAIINYLSHHVEQPVLKWTLVLTGYGVSVLSAWILYKIIEKPSQQLSKRIKI